MKQNIGTDALIITLSRVITLSISMVAIMLLSRYLTLEEYGTYSQVLIVIELVLSIFLVGLPSAINYFVAKDENEKFRQDFFSTYYSLSTLLCILAGVVIYFSTPLIISYFDNPLLKEIMYIVSILPWAKATMNSISNVLIVYGKTSKLFIYQLLHSICTVLTIILLKLVNISFHQYMLLFLIVECIFAFIVFVLVKNLTGRLKIVFNIKLIKEILKYSIPIGLATAVGTINIQLDKIMIGKFFSVEELAIYSNVSRELPVTFIAASITAVLLPNIVKKISQNEMKSAVKLWGDAAILSYNILCFFVAILFVFSPEVITILYSDKYIDGLDVFRVYSLVLLLRFTYFGMILNAIGKTKFIFYSSILSLVLNVILNYIFYLLFGFIGPAVASFISIIFINFLQLGVTCKYIKIPLSRLFNWLKIGYITLINVVIGLIYYFIIQLAESYYPQHSLLITIFIILLWTVTYILLFKKEFINGWNNLKVQ